jgi:hypothetical protein
MEIRQQPDMRRSKNGTSYDAVVQSKVSHYQPLKDQSGSNTQKVGLVSFGNPMFIQSTEEMKQIEPDI